MDLFHFLDFIPFYAYYIKSSKILQETLVNKYLFYNIWIMFNNILEQNNLKK